MHGQANMDASLSSHLKRGEVDFVLFTTRTCPYCVKAKQVLNRNGFSWKEYDVAKTRSVYSLVVAETRLRTVPAVFDTRGEEPVFVGGCDDLAALLRAESSPPAKNGGLFGFLHKKR